MPVKRALLLGFGLLMVWLIGVLDLRFHPYPDVRLINDNYDREIYFRIGSWVVHNEVPYRDIFSEYAQVPTYLFALPYLGLSWLYPMDKLGYRGWICAFSLLMLALLFVETLLLHRMIRTSKYLAFLLLLPAYLYFAYNRFDILPALICLISYECLSRKKFIWAAALLGIGAMTKWYPALLVPIYLTWAWRANRKFPLGMILSFAGVCLVLILPTLLLGGWTAFWDPYQFHAGREFASASFPGLIDPVLGLIPGYSSGILHPIFLLLQFIPSLLLALAKPNSLRKVLHGMILVIASFFLFAPIYSPQWVLWLAPFLILAIQDRGDILWIAAGGSVTYLAFPVLFDLYGIGHPVMSAMGILQAAFLLRVIVVSLRRMGENSSENSGTQETRPPVHMTAPVA